ALGNGDTGIAVTFKNLGATQPSNPPAPSYTTIGGTAAGAGNLISGNFSYGVLIDGTWGGAVSNLVQGNLIGTDVTGLQGLGNGQDGVLINNASINTIGGTTPAARNVISDNAVPGNLVGSGIWVNGSNSVGNLIEGNYIGTDATGTRALGNYQDG